MNDVLVAAILWILTSIRLPTLSVKRARPAFWGSLCASLAFTLYVPETYLAVDEILGGGNVVGLLLSELIVASLWQIHVSLRLATPSRRSNGPWPSWTLWWALSSLAMLATYPWWKAEVSTRWLVSLYGAQPALLVFQLIAVSFIAGVSIDAVRISRPRLRQMGRLFRIGFSMVTLGFGTAAILVTLRVLGNFFPQGSPTKAGIETFYEAGQQAVVVLVSIGLSIPRLHAAYGGILLSVQSRAIIWTLAPAWRRLASTETEIILDSRPYSRWDAMKTGCVARLQRRVTEIRDGETRGSLSGKRLTARESDTIGKAERLLQGYSVLERRRRQKSGA